jgi:hypothetical protein
MPTRFKSTYSDHDAFYARADLLREMFGHWDCEDPVSHAILDVVEAQRELSDLFYDDATYGLGSEAAYAAAVQKRHAPGKKLMKALADRECWPDPKLGQPNTPSFEAKAADDRYVVYPQRYLGKFSGYATLWYPPDYDPKEDIPHFLGFIKKTAAEAKALAEFHYAPSNKVL